MKRTFRDNHHADQLEVELFCDEYGEPSYLRLNWRRGGELIDTLTTEIRCLPVDINDREPPEWWTGRQVEARD